MPTLGDMIQAQGSPAEWGAMPWRSSLASAYLTSNLTLTGAADWYEIGSGAETYTEYFDYGNNFDASGTGRYTCPVSGVYRFTANIEVSTPGYSELAIVAIALAISGTPSIQVGARAVPSATPMTSIIVNGSTLRAFSANDTLSCCVYAGETSTHDPVITGGGLSFISFELVSL